MPSPNVDARPYAVDMLVMHYTGMQSAEAAIERLRDPASRVSSHYVIDEDGQIYRLVPEEQRAWHAGISYWRGKEVLNDGSIGIEIVNPGHEWGYRPFPAAQIANVIALSQDILARHAIPPGNVVAHSDIAPDRKQDPGELFPWSQLASHGIGLWADCDGADLSATADDLRPALAALGYDMRDASPGRLAIVLRAFQRHWRPEAVTGVADRGTAARLRKILLFLKKEKQKDF
jgi:N-acetylmuramoyl-L-alanine amidase